MATRQEGTNNLAPVLFRSYENPLEKSEFAGHQALGGRSGNFSGTHWTEDEAGNWTWKQLETRVEGGVAEMDDITAIDATKEQAKKYIALAGAQKVIEECAEVLREEL
ncbi:hypothetical protein J7337_011067 [Fusarium musae]|uniref:Uncharacterized protein n=1 Tax=Fusarium musae TaxID=1042133 RepID=A0A9P8ILS7_9HYPO|nr:hypothetical protein J7337_011067 [Fusarium musae]KAG9498172.1 hypothetical protein J7337_011067 [Fusarium musae]